MKKVTETQPELDWTKRSLSVEVTSSSEGGDGVQLVCVLSPLLASLGSLTYKLHPFLLL